MIKILADSPDDGALIAKAIDGDARIVTDSVRFANGDGDVECRILGCRQPIPPERIELLRNIDRAAPWVPVILVTDRAPDVARRLSDVRVAAVVWFAELRTELEPGIAAARQSVPLLRLAERAEEAELPPALRPSGFGRQRKGTRPAASRWVAYRFGAGFLGVAVLPTGQRLLAASGGLLWTMTEDGLGIPQITGWTISWPSGGEE